ncbi:hypothetical protein [Paenibacillus dakarensis]|uniref:hypothetical protein n=1 Tax=Paenibacillus dakarensis TaxID=1527293 RepID=UPI0006D59D3A|nr:hypothetical protein [Paenibacillus dakarensis]
MEQIISMLNRPVEVELSGHKMQLRGHFVDIGNDVLVLFSKSRYYYIPIHHLQHLRLADEWDTPVSDEPAPLKEHTHISYRKMLMNSRGTFSEMYLGGQHALHGYVTSIMNDYFVYFSPLYRTVYIPIHHVKYLVPYPPNVTPYTLSQEHFPIQPAVVSLSRTWDQQLHKLQGQLVIFDLGGHPQKTGLLQSIDNNLIELIQADGRSNFVHADHIKCVHLP